MPTQKQVYIIATDTVPAPVEFAVAQEILRTSPELRVALLAELAELSRRKLETAIVTIDPPLLQQLAYLDGKMHQIRSLLLGDFVSNPAVPIEGDSTEEFKS